MLAVLATVLTVAAVVISVYTATRTSEPGQPVGRIVPIGAFRGDSIPNYVATSNAALSQIVAAAQSRPKPREMYALVAFKSYVTPSDLSTLLAGVHVTTAFMRVPLPGVPTEFVQVQAYSLPGDVNIRMLSEARIQGQSAKDLQALAAQNNGSSDEQQRLHASYERLADVASQEAMAYRSLCACVYAAVIYAPPAALGALAARGEVRVVDAVPNLPSPDRARFVPPVPEQDGLADPPPDNSDTAP